MPAERLSMRHLRELLRLHQNSGLSQRAIAHSLGIAQGTVSKYLWRARQAGLSWPLPAEFDDDDRLEARLFPPLPDLPPDKRPKPDWAEVHRELRRQDVTLALLWEEYKGREPDGFGYSWFCDLYKEWAGRLKPTMRQVHIAGEKLFVDYAGRTMEVIDGTTGEISTVQIFVAVLGASELHLQRGKAHTRNRCPTGSARTPEPSHSSAGLRDRPSATTCAPASPAPAFTSPSSTAPTRISPDTTAQPWCRPDPTSRATRPRWKSACRSSDVG